MPSYKPDAKKSVEWEIVSHFCCGKCKARSQICFTLNPFWSWKVAPSPRFPPSPPPHQPQLPPYYNLNRYPLLAQSTTPDWQSKGIKSPLFVQEGTMLRFFPRSTKKVPAKNMRAKEFSAKIYFTGEIIHTSITWRILLLSLHVPVSDFLCMRFVTLSGFSTPSCPGYANRLQCLYGNPIANNFFSQNLWIAILKYWVEDCIY